MEAQKELEARLGPELKEWYRILTGMVKAGNCIADDGEALGHIDRVSLETDTKGILKGLVFHIDWTRS